MPKIRKAVTAFVLAAAGAVVTSVMTDGAPADTAGWLKLLGAAAGVGLAAAVAVWRVPNAPAVEPPADPSIKRSWTT